MRRRIFPFPADFGRGLRAFAFSRARPSVKSHASHGARLKLVRDRSLIAKQGRECQGGSAFWGANASEVLDASTLGCG